MPTTVICSVGSRTADSVTVSTVTSTTVTGYTNAWSVVLSATVPTTTKIGDKLTTGANNYLITNISGSTLTVVGDAGIAFTSTSTPSTGAATTARAYSSPDLWSPAAPASLVAKDWIWRGEIYKEGGGTNNEWVLGSSFVDVNIVFNSTGDSTRYFIMTSAAGQSFRDNANKLTNELRYNPANGVSIYCAGNFSSVNISTGTAPVYVSNLQLKGKNQLAYAPASGGCKITYDSCICIGTAVEQIYANNTLFIGSFFQNQSINLFVACTMIGSGSALNSVSGAAITLTDCAVFNATSINGLSASCNYNATDLATAPTNWGANSIVNKTYANQFQNIGSGTEDFRVKSGADLISAGTRAQTYTSDLDIVGSARSITTPTIGAWEFPSVTYTYARPASDITTQWSTSSGTDHYALIDETVASDTDYIVATAAGQTDEVKLASMTAPQAGTDLKVNYRVQGISGSASVTLSLVCNTTVIATDTARTANGDYTLTVASGTWASVSDWTNMRLRFVSA